MQKPLGHYMPAHGTFGGDALITGSGSGDGTVSTDDTTATANTQSYWFTYAADNRVDIASGSLAGGDIQLDNRAGSIEKIYGNPPAFA